MHKKLILGSVLALILTLTSPVVAVEEFPRAACGGMMMVFVDLAALRKIFTFLLSH